MSDEKRPLIGEFRSYPFGNLPPEGFYDFSKIEVIVYQTEERPQRNISFKMKLKKDEETMMVEDFIPGDERTKKVMKSFSPLMDAFALGFSSSFQVFMPLVRKENEGGFRISYDRSQRVFPQDYHTLYHTLTTKIDKLSEEEDNESIQRFLRSLRKYRIALDNEKHSIEFFENIVIALESLFINTKLKNIEAPTSIWCIFREKMKELSKQAIEKIIKEGEIQAEQKVLNQVHNNVLDAIDNTYMPIKDKVIIQFKKLIELYKEKYKTIPLDVEKTVIFYLRNIDRWFKVRGALFHESNVSSASWEEYTSMAYEIKRAINAYYFMFLHVKDCFQDFHNGFPTDEQVKNFWSMVVRKEIKALQIPSEDDVPQWHHIQSNLTQTVEEFILFYLYTVKKASVSEIIAASFPFGINILNYSTYYNVLNSFTKEGILKQTKENLYLANFDDLNLHF